MSTFEALYSHPIRGSTPVRRMIADNSSWPICSLKVGYAGQNFPTHQYPSIVGRPILRAEERSGDQVPDSILLNSPSLTHTPN